MNNANFGKTMENIRKNHDIKLVTIEKRTNYLVSEPNCKSTKWFSEKLLEIEMAETKVTMCKLVQLNFSMLDLRKIKMYEFCYDYIKEKYVKKI